MSIARIADRLEETQRLYNLVGTTRDDANLLELAAKRGLVTPEEAEDSKAIATAASKTWYESQLATKREVTQLLADQGIDADVLKRWL